MMRNSLAVLCVLTATVISPAEVQLYFEPIPETDESLTSNAFDRLKSTLGTSEIAANARLYANNIPPDDPAYAYTGWARQEPFTIIRIENEADFGESVSPEEDENIIESSEATEALITNSLVPISYLTKALAMEKAVGRVTLTQPVEDRITGKTLGPGQGFGTGFLVGPSMFMTNQHVMIDKKIAGTHRIWFNYQCTGPECDNKARIFETDPDTFYYEDKTLDFAIVALKNAEINNQSIKPGDLYNFVPLKEHASYSYSKKLRVNIIQHPGGNPKQLAIHENKIVEYYKKAHASRFAYTADTMPGSSGSPLFDNHWLLVGIHRAAGEEAGGVYINNEGIRIDKIVQHLQGLNAIDGRTQSEFWNLLTRHPATPTNTETDPH